MRHVGDNRIFLAAAAVLMAALVIAAMFSINAKLENALVPTATGGATPALKVVTPAPAPKTQVIAPASVAPPATPSPTPSVEAPSPTLAPAPETTKVKIISKPLAPVVATGSQVHKIQPSVTTTLPVTPTTTAPLIHLVPPVNVPTVTVTVAPPSDIGDSPPSSGESHGKKKDSAPLGGTSVADSVAIKTAANGDKAIPAKIDGSGDSGKKKKDSSDDNPDHKSDDSDHGDD
jgi:hypothetical protein